MLRALSTSWDWARIYRGVDALAGLEMPRDDEARWAQEQLGLVDRTAKTIADAPVRTVGAARVATVTIRRSAAPVCVEGLAGVRDDVDAVAFLAGPGRLKVIATSPGGLAFLDEVEGLKTDFEQHVMAGCVTPGLAELTWTPGSVPTSAAVLVGEEAVDRARAVEAGAVARIERPQKGRRDCIRPASHPTTWPRFAKPSASNRARARTPSRIRVRILHRPRPCSTPPCETPSSSCRRSSSPTRERFGAPLRSPGLGLWRRCGGAGARGPLRCSWRAGKSGRQRDGLEGGPRCRPTDVWSSARSSA